MQEPTFYQESRLMRRPTPIEVEQKLERFSHVMDTLFRVPGIGWRFGLDAVIGLIPGVGDTATALIALYLLGSAIRYRVPKITLVRMGMNIGIDYVVGLIPLFGDLFTAWWKPNKRNLDLLKLRATVSADEAKLASHSDKVFVSVIILSLIGLVFGSFLFILLVIYYMVTHISVGSY